MNSPTRRARKEPTIGDFCEAAGKVYRPGDEIERLGRVYIVDEVNRIGRPTAASLRTAPDETGHHLSFGSALAFRSWARGQL